MTTLEKIKAAAKMGYSAICELELDDADVLYDLGTGKVVYLNDIYLQFQHGPNVKWKDVDFEHQWKITGYTYVGMLFGEPEILYGQRFRFKESKEIFTATGYGEDLILYHSNSPYGPLVAKKCDVEPVFD